MADKSNIEWTEATWNPIAGCDLVSPGCTNCYAMRRVAPRLSKNPATPHYAGTVKPSKAGPVWTGAIGIASDKVMTKPLRWTRPRMIFVNSTSDLFHPGVPDEVIDRIFAVMALSPQHTFQILTKRPERMRGYLRDESTPGRIARSLIDRCFIDRVWPTPADDDWPVQSIGNIDDPDDVTIGFPLTNVWLGVSVEDQTRADERVPILLDTPAAIRWISAEPLLGPVDLTLDGLMFRDCPQDCEHSVYDSSTNATECLRCEDTFKTDEPGLDWIVAGGESGPGARPMNPEWARSIRDQCAEAGLPFLLKQWGEFVPCVTDDVGDGVRCHPTAADSIAFQGDRQHPVISVGGQEYWRVGKKLAGRTLDGVTHDGFPEARS